MSDQDPEDDLPTVVCMPDPLSMFTDDEHGTCDMGCGRSIAWRPHMPKPAKHVCLDCAGPMLKNLPVVVTPATVREVLDYMLAQSAKGDPS